MWEHVTPDSDDIEVFFIERMKQLLRRRMAGIITEFYFEQCWGLHQRERLF